MIINQITNFLLHNLCTNDAMYNGGGDDSDDHGIYTTLNRFFFSNNQINSTQVVGGVHVPSYYVNNNNHEIFYESFMNESGNIQVTSGALQFHLHHHHRHHANLENRRWSYCLTTNFLIAQIINHHY